MRTVSDQIGMVEERLERLLASGWRSAAAEAAELEPEAGRLAELGLPELAGRLRQVAAASGPAEALAAVALAAAACRLLRARLAAEGGPPPGSWAPLEPARKKGAPARLLPVARLAIGDGQEAWACLRLRGSQAGELLLLPAAPTGPPPSLRRPLAGQLRWQARYPLGASGELQAVALDQPDWQAPWGGDEDPLSDFRARLSSGKLNEGPLFPGGGPVKVLQIDPAEADLFVWPHPATAAAFQAAATGKGWALAWVDGSLILPLALLSPGGLFRSGRLIHLVEGAPADPL